MKLEELRQEIQVGIEQAKGGALLDGPQALEKLRNKVRAKSPNGRDK